MPRRLIAVVAGLFAALAIIGAYRFASSVQGGDLPRPASNEAEP